MPRELKSHFFPCLLASFNRNAQITIPLLADLLGFTLYSTNKQQQQMRGSAVEVPPNELRVRKDSIPMHFRQRKFKGIPFEGYPLSLPPKYR